ncbi:MAG: hypothetical protein K5829_09425 [Treponema sp.]|nr:hypothetical protein [Treponema sp.]
MDKSRRNKRHSNWNRQKNNNASGNQEREKNSEKGKKKFQPSYSSNYDEELAKKSLAIHEFKSREVICPKCGQVINDVASALADKSTGQPIHFECALSEVEKNEKLEQNERIAYIGKGRFGVLYYENPSDQRHFTIKRIIEWEDKDQKSEWREEVSDLYSKVN